MHIFAVVANSAGCERAFSKFGITHTKLRNKIDPIRVHKMAVVGMEQGRLDRAASLARNRQKRKFGEDNTAANPPIPNLPDSPDSETPDFQRYARDLIQQAQISRDDEGSDVVTPEPATPIPAAPNLNAQPSVNPARSASLMLTRKTDIPLAKLFDYSLSPEDGLEFYWPRSKKNLEADLRAHEQAWADEFSNGSSSQTLNC